MDDEVTVTPENPPPVNPDADELAALRKEKADREAAAQADKDREIEELRKFKAEQEKKPVVKAPEKKAEKVVAPETPPTPTPAPAAKKRRVWWSDPE